MALHKQPRLPQQCSACTPRHQDDGTHQKPPAPLLHKNKTNHQAHILHSSENPAIVLQRPYRTLRCNTTIGETARDPRAAHRPVGPLTILIVHVRRGRRVSPRIPHRGRRFDALKETPFLEERPLLTLPLPLLPKHTPQYGRVRKQRCCARDNVSRRAARPCCSFTSAQVKKQKAKK